MRKQLIQKKNDPYLKNVYLAVTGKYSIIDSSPNNRSLSSVGSPIITPQFGRKSTSILLNTSYIYTNQPAGIVGDYTIESWVWFNSIPATYNNGRYSIIGSCNFSTVSPRWYLGVYSSNNTSINYLYYYWSASTDVYVAYNFALNTWYHVAVSKVGNNTRLFVNGNIIYTIRSNTTLPLGVISLGGREYNGYNHYLNGCVEGFKITDGIGRYTTDFIPDSNTFCS